MNPLFNAVEKDQEIEMDNFASGQQIRKDALGQLPIPWRKKTHTFDPEFHKDDMKKLVKYKSEDLKIWGALVSFSHTLISDGDTWSHLSILTVICFITMAITIVTGSYKSVDDHTVVFSRIYTLISFVFAGYITLVVNRWDRIRNTTLGQVWGAIENLNVIAFRGLKSENEENEKLKDLITRMGRLVMRLTFLACQADSNMEPLIESGILLPKEKLWLGEATVGTRPLIVVNWIYSYFDALAEKGIKFPDPVDSQIHMNILSLRGGVGATLGAIGAQLPYPYVHCVFWTIQILLMALAIETGVCLATNMLTKSNGDGGWDPNDDSVSWPENPNIWFVNSFLQITASNIIFALFCEGMLKICDKLSNPMSKEDTSFSELVYDVFLYNNCRALRVGFISYSDVNKTED